MPTTNRQILLNGRPDGEPKASDFKLGEAPIPKPGPGQFLIRNHYLSLDPFQRGRMNANWRYGRKLEIGDVMIGSTVGEIIESYHPAWRTGTFVEGLLGWQEYALHDGEGGRQDYGPGLTRVDPKVAPVSTALGVLGTSGETAYWSIIDVAKPRPGDTVVISGAAGAVGTITGQICKILGARVVGIAGSDDKVDYITRELGFDAGINYKTTPNLLDALRQYCPDRIDVYYDNVGGEIADMMFRHLAKGARYIVVGRIANYNDAKPRLMPDLFPLIMTSRAQVHGFIVFDYEDRIREARAQLARWIDEGRIKYRETIAHGLENAPAAFMSMLKGGNTGKQLVKLFPDAR